jgi:hypothetical protein
MFQLAVVIPANNYDPRVLPFDVYFYEVTLEQLLSLNESSDLQKLKRVLLYLSFHIERKEYISSKDTIDEIKDELKYLKLRLNPPPDFYLIKKPPKPKLRKSPLEEFHKNYLNDFYLNFKMKTPHIYP